MAPSHLSGMEMRSLLFGVLFGLLAVVHSTPVTTVTQDEVYREVLTDGYIIDSHIPLTTTPSVSHAQSSTVLPFNTNDSISISNTQTDEKSQDEQGSRAETSTASPTILAETGSGDFAAENPKDVYTTTTKAATQDEVYREVVTDGYIIDSHAISPLTTTPSSRMTSIFNTETSTASPTFLAETGSGDFAAENPEDAYTTTTKETSPASSTFLTEESGSGSGSGLGDFTAEKDVFTTTTKETSTASSTLPAEESGQGYVVADITASSTSNGSDIHAQPLSNDNLVSVTHKQFQGHTTPGWIIIVGFIVGLAALIMLCAAIATRDKWNGPKQASQVGTNANSSNQQRELEMETFLHSDKPRENGKAADYTVVPLDDVPENYSSH